MSILATILAIVWFIAFFALLFVVLFNIQKTLCDDCPFKDRCFKDSNEDDFVPPCMKNRFSQNNNNLMNW